MGAEHNLMTDDLLRQIIGAGRVDLLVGLPHIDRPDEAAGLVRAVRACFRSHFPRQRGALLYAGAVGSDETTALVRRLWDDQDHAAGGGLRTTHLLTTTVPALNHEAGPARLFLAAGDLLQARAIVALDLEAGVEPARVAALAAPLGDAEVDLVAPQYARNADEGLLITQLLRPLTRAVFGVDLREPLMPAFGCSTRLAAHCAQVDFSINRGRLGTYYWVGAEAIANSFAIRQLPMGPRPAPAGQASRGLATVFERVVSSAFLSIENHSTVWLNRPAAASPAIEDRGRAGAPPRVPEAPGTFATDIDNLNEILQRILSPALHAAIREAAGQPVSALPAALWAATVGEFLLAHHHGVMLREHIVQALMPLYIARAGTFLAEHAADPPAEVEAALETLCTHFERITPRIIESWTQPAKG